MSWEKLFENLQNQGLNLLKGVIVLIVGFFIVKWVLKLSNKRLNQVKIDPTVESFLRNLIRLGLYLIVVLTAASVMGIPLTSILTLIASASVAISLAFQGALSNLVGGFFLLILKPIKVGEYVKIGEPDASIEGTVQGIGAFYTELMMPDKRLIMIPNSSLTNTPIINFNRDGSRRLDMTYSVGYESDMDQVFALLKGLAEDNDKIFKEPAPVIHLKNYGDSSLDFLLRIWCKNEDYWDINYFLLEEGKRRLDQAGINIPYPQMDVHIIPNQE